MSFITTIDTSILHFIKDHTRNKFLDKTMPFISRLGNCGFIWICAIFALCASHQYRKYVPLILASLLVSFLVGEVAMKTSVRRIRPCNLEDDVSLLIRRPADFSFPSGHSMSSFTVASLIWYLDHYLGGIALTMASLIALSRLYLFVHYPTDVIAGSVFGKVVAFAIYHLAILH